MKDGPPVFEFIQTMFSLNIEMSETKEVPLKVSFLVISELLLFGAPAQLIKKIFKFQNTAFLLVDIEICHNHFF